MHDNRLWINWSYDEREDYALRAINRSASVGDKLLVAQQAKSLLLDADYYVTKTMRYNGDIYEIKLEALVGDDIPTLVRNLWEIHILTGRNVEMNVNGSLITFKNAV